MKSVIYCENLYQDSESLHDLISELNYKDCYFGQQIPDFSFIPNGLQDFFSEIVGEKIEIQPDTGFFRRSNNLIHIESFYQHCQYVCIAALEDTKLKIWKHKNNLGVFDVADRLEEFLLSDCADVSQWTVSHELSIFKNNFVFIRPTLWFSLEINTLVQIFLLNHRSS